MGEIARSKSRIASDSKTRDSNRWRPCDSKLRFETRDWRFVLNIPIQQNCEKGCDLSPRSKIASDWRLAILPRYGPKSIGPQFEHKHDIKSTKTQTGVAKVYTSTVAPVLSQLFRPTPRSQSKKLWCMHFLGENNWRGPNPPGANPLLAERAFSEVPPVLLEFHDQLWLFHGGGPSKKGNGTNRTGGSAILKFIWGGNLLCFPGFGDLQPYETWKFRICSESVSGVFPDLFRISLRNCLTVLGAPPTFPTSSDYWGRTGVAGCAEEMRQESVGISNRLLTLCHTRL